MFDGSLPLQPHHVIADDTYTRIVESNKSHPVVRDYFHQVMYCLLPFVSGRSIPFFMLEFRDGDEAAWMWTDGNGQWTTGGWFELADDGAPKEPSIEYFCGNRTCLSFADALELLMED